MFSETRYALNGDLRVAYRTSREGPRDIVFVPTWFTNCEVFPELPSIQGWIEAMTSLGRLIFLDQPGTVADLALYLVGGMTEFVVIHLDTLGVGADVQGVGADVQGVGDPLLHVGPPVEHALPSSAHKSGTIAPVPHLGEARGRCPQRFCNFCRCGEV